MPKGLGRGKTRGRRVDGTALACRVRRYTVVGRGAFLATFELVIAAGEDRVTVRGCRLFRRHDGVCYVKPPAVRVGGRWMSVAPWTGAFGRKVVAALAALQDEQPAECGVRDGHGNVVMMLTVRDLKRVEDGGIIASADAAVEDIVHDVTSAGRRPDEDDFVAKPAGGPGRILNTGQWVPEYVLVPEPPQPRLPRPI